MAGSGWKLAMEITSLLQADEKARHKWNSPLFEHFWETTVAIEIATRVEEKLTAKPLWDHIQHAFHQYKRRECSTSGSGNNEMRCAVINGMSEKLTSPLSRGRIPQMTGVLRGRGG